MDTIPDDLLSNIANITKQLNNYRNNNGTPTNNIDITGINDKVSFPEPITAPPRPDMNSSMGSMTVSSNIPGLEKRLLGANLDTINETNRVLAIEKPKDEHSEFKVDVKELSNIEELINEYQGIISKLKTKKAELRQRTLNHMVHHKIDTAKVSTKESFSVVNTKKKINPTTKIRLPHKIRDFFIREEKMDDKKAEELSKRIVKWVHDNAEYQSAKVLRHKKNKST